MLPMGKQWKTWEIEFKTLDLDLRLVSNEKGYLIWASKPNHMSQKNIWQWFSCNSGKQSFINT